MKVHAGTRSAEYLLAQHLAQAGLLRLFIRTSASRFQPGGQLSHGYVMHGGWRIHCNNELRADAGHRIGYAAPPEFSDSKRSRFVQRGGRDLRGVGDAFGVGERYPASADVRQALSLGEEEAKIKQGTSGPFANLNEAGVPVRMRWWTQRSRS